MDRGGNSPVFFPVEDTMNVIQIEAGKIIRLKAELVKTLAAIDNRQDDLRRALTDLYAALGSVYQKGDERK
jgi:hypothetical protein